MAKQLAKTEDRSDNDVDLKQDEPKRSCWRELLGGVWHVFLLTLTINPKMKRGEQEAYSIVGGALSIAVVSAGAFALTVDKVSGSWTTAAFLYVLLTMAICLQVLLIVNKSINPALLKYDETTAWIGRITIFVAGFFCIALIAMAGAQLFPGQSPQRRDYTAIDIPCASAILASNFQPMVNPRGAFRDATDEDIKDIERFQRWMAPIVNEPTKEQILILRQYPSFDDAYNTFSVVILHTPAAEFKDLLVLLRRRSSVASGENLSYRLLGWRWGDMSETSDSYEQLRVPRDQSGKPYPVITVPRPRDGDSLMVFIRFVAKDDKSPLGIDPEWFMAKLRRTQR